MLTGSTNTTTAIQSNGTTAITIDASQNVGIGGTPSTGYKLEVLASQASRSAVVSSNTNSAGSSAYHLATDVSTNYGNMICFGSTHASRANSMWIGTDGGNAPLVFQVNGSEVGRFDTSANFKFNSGYGSVATAYGCRAWVNFNGVTTATIRASGNVTSVTRNSAGDYTINFTTAMPDANYAVNITGLSATATDGRAAYFVKGVRSTGTPSTQTTSAVGVQSVDAGTGGWAAIDAGYVCVAIFR
jgi:hypothetical protein